MPTGYTEGILSGKIKEFKDFAELCTRAYLVHMRDHPFDSPYVKREPSDCHSKSLKKAQDQLKKLEDLTEEELLKETRDELLDNLAYYQNSKQKAEENKEKIEAFLEKAKKYQPPTERHESIAKFMIDQLESTLDHDCDNSYYIKKIKELGREIKALNVDQIRKETTETALQDIDRHTREHEEEVKRCQEQNKWYEDFINSLNL